ncbi:MAG: hypothetical protein LBT37_01530 [Lactobacillaceae bacterium]|jgi:CHASE2 domain-containing sensor protein|nr:hypothetical protein [Lactobacillaceae bacterium]
MNKYITPSKIGLIIVVIICIVMMAFGIAYFMVGMWWIGIFLILAGLFGTVVGSLRLKLKKYR